MELPSESKFFRVGRREYVFLSLLDGEITFAQALTLSAQVLGVEALSRQQAHQCYHWLLENGLAKLVDAAGRRRTPPTRPPSSWRRFANPFWMQVPLLRPDRWLKPVAHWCGWIFAFWPMTAGSLLIASSWLTLATQWRRFTDDTRLVLHRDNWLWLLGAWIVLKVVHEAAHAIACKRLGGRVREMGVVLILFAPMAYVNVTSSWRIASKWRRMQVAVAGIYVELVLAAIAIFWWSVSVSPFWSHIAHNLIVTAGLATILFNANPLMRFDGYYLLSDLLEIPNLYSEGSQSVQDAARWLLFGERSTRPRAGGARGVLITAYGVAAGCWRIVVCASLLIAASVLWRGAGVALAGLAIALWLSSTLQKAATELHRRLTEQPHGLAQGRLSDPTWVRRRLAGLDSHSGPRLRDAHPALWSSRIWKSCAARRTALSNTSWRLTARRSSKAIR